MKVEAIKKGYHGKLREKGDVFEVPNGSKASWFTPVKKTGKPAGGQQANKPAGGQQANKPAGEQSADEESAGTDEKA
ncbi:MAG: hypothetical protein U5L08_04410 [Xanthomonadales bacterium]|nr:hypothetical protein [Xanthomonadales bacterium]